jgi:DNA-binding transcriptional ArsR family regulator
MTSNARFAEIAALAGDPARTAMLHALLDGRALTASELAKAASVTPQTASGHLARMAEAGLISVLRQGRHRYHRLASPAVARMMESIMQVAAGSALSDRPRTGPRDQALRAARTCYDHLAGGLGVALADAMLAAGQVELSADAGLVTEKGRLFLKALGVEVAGTEGGSRRVFCRPCLDWSERRLHIGGAVGALLCSHCFDQGWIRRIEGTRAVRITPKGQQAFRQEFRLDHPV